MFGHRCGVSEWAESVFVRDREGGPLAWANGLGFQRPPAPAAHRGQQGWVWPRVPVSGCLCEFPPEVFSWQCGISCCAAKGGDCWHPVRPGGVIPEVRTEARGGSLGTFLSCTALEPPFQQDYRL